MDSVHNLFAAISAYGVTLFASSGDYGAFGSDPTEQTIGVSYPASDPLVTGVGGTSLYLSSALTVNIQTIEGETGWSFDTGNGSSGGGYSNHFPLPSYQSRVKLADTFGNGTGMRQVPDVSLVADPETGAYLIFRNEPVVIGGTSWSSPCWAGMCALLNQARAEAGFAPLTRLNAKIYPLQNTNGFRDILPDGSGSNNGIYDTTKGYDLVTGLGVPNFTALNQNLLADARYPQFFAGQELLSDNIYYLTLPSGTSFSYYTFLNGSTHYLYHFDLGYEYVFDANDDDSGIYLYDFSSQTFWYTASAYPFPYLYDFSLNTVLYYYPDPNNPGRYDTGGVRYFYRFDTGEIITK